MAGSRLRIYRFAEQPLENRLIGLRHTLSLTSRNCLANWRYLKQPRRGERPAPKVMARSVPKGLSSSWQLNFSFSLVVDLFRRYEALRSNNHVTLQGLLKSRRTVSDDGVDGLKPTRVERIACQLSGPGKITGDGGSLLAGR
jgi:hypothetical protein